MRTKLHATTALCAATTLMLAGCGGSDTCWNCGGGPGTTTSYVGTTDVLVGWADPSTMSYDTADTSLYAGKRQFIRGNVSPYTGDDLGQPAGAEIYEFMDGTIHLLDLADIGPPQALQLSTEAAAPHTLACTATGASAYTGATSDYAGVYFAASLAHPASSLYVYRLPGTDGTCGTADDVVHAVRTGMMSTDAPLVAAAMPAATVSTAGGDIGGFVAKSGTSVVLLDANLANPVTLATYASPVGVLQPLPTGQVAGYETGRLFIVDGDIVHVDYAAHTVSSSLFTIPGWTSTDNHLAATAASPDTFFFATYAGGSSSVYSMPADGSAAPVLMSTVTGRVTQLEVPVGGTSLLVAVEDTAFSILAMPLAGGLSTTVLLGDLNSGRFTATATSVYWTQWTNTVAGTSATRSGLKSGISGQDGSVVMAATANSMFMNGGEAVPWVAGDLTTVRTPLATVFQVTGLVQSTTVSANGRSWTAPILTGGTIQSISTSTNAVVATIGTFGSTTTAMLLDGTVHPAIGHWMFIDAQTLASSQDPATHDVYLVESQTAGSLLRASFNL